MATAKKATAKKAAAKKAPAKKAAAKKARRPRRPQRRRRRRKKAAAKKAGQEGGREEGAGEEGGRQEGAGARRRRPRRRRRRRPRPRRRLRRRPPPRRRREEGACEEGCRQEGRCEEAPPARRCAACGRAGSEDDAEPAGGLAVPDGQQALRRAWPADKPGFGRVFSCRSAIGAACVPSDCIGSCRRRRPAPALHRRVPDRLLARARSAASTRVRSRAALGRARLRALRLVRSAQSSWPC